MNRTLYCALIAAALSAPSLAQEAPEGAPSPNEIVAAAPESEWIRIAPDDLLVMTLAPDAERNPRQVVIQLMPAPFSQGWVDNIRTFARSGWYDNISVNRVQDNYVVQWGDVNYDNPEATGDVKPLPEGLKVMGEDDYKSKVADDQGENALVYPKYLIDDQYSKGAYFDSGWPLATDSQNAWPVHCYGMVGVGRNYSPDTGTGAELYTVIGHAPRHLDRNIAVVGRILEGMEHLSSLPRGKGDLGFYREDEIEKRTPILSVRVASDLPEVEQPKLEFLDTGKAKFVILPEGEYFTDIETRIGGETFASYADARANRRDPFFIVPAGGADICNIPVPIRRASGE